MFFRKLENDMKILAIMILVAVSGCADGRSNSPGGSELAHKCLIDPFNYECLYPPAVFHN